MTPLLIGQINHLKVQKKSYDGGKEWKSTLSKQSGDFVDEFCMQPLEFSKSSRMFGQIVDVMQVCFFRQL